jgi:hypothetical protein
MKSLLHPYVSNLMGTSGGRYLAITATVTTFTVGSILAQEYDQTNMVAPDDPFDVRMPSVDEYVRSVVFSSGLTARNGVSSLTQAIMACSGG